MIAAIEWPQRIERAPLHQTIADLYNGEPLSRIEDLVPRIKDNVKSRANVLRNLQSQTHLIECKYYLESHVPVPTKMFEDLGYGELEQAIVHRRCAYLKAIIHTRHNSIQDLKPIESNGKFSSVELALGWRQGLKALLSAGFDGSHAVLLSIASDDVESTRLLLEESDFPGDLGVYSKEYFRGFAWFEAFTLALESRDHEMQQLVVQSFRDRRKALTDLALEKLPKTIILESKISKDEIADSQALRIYNLLHERGVRVPIKLNPYMASIKFVQHESVYCSLSQGNLVGSTEFADIIYESGFTSIDEPVFYGRTALSKILEQIPPSSYDSLLRYFHLIHWFLGKGASATFTGARCYPSILFYLTRLLRGQTSLFSGAVRSEFERLFRRSALISDPLMPDECDCYCSKSGCLFFHMAWKCFGSFSNHDGCGRMTSKALFHARDWVLSLGNFEKSQVGLLDEGICRHEVFDRLGMVHTCCEADYSGERCMLKMAEDERSRTREEDGSLKEQLDLILQIYRSKQEKQGGHSAEFWETWWEQLGDILPDLRSEERCKHHCLPYYDYLELELDEEAHRAFKRGIQDRRLGTEKEALLKLGYFGLDFLEVIRRHFAEDLVPEPNAYDHIAQESTEQMNSSIGTDSRSENGAYGEPLKTPTTMLSSQTVQQRKDGDWSSSFRERSTDESYIGQ